MAGWSANLDWVWYAAAMVVGLGGALLLVRALFADRARGRLRCPKCWYDMSGAPAGVLACPECGRDAKRVPRLQRTRRKWWRAGFACVLIVIALGLTRGPGAMQRGWWGAVPTTALILMIPQIDSGQHPVEWELVKRLAPGTPMKGVRAAPGGPLTTAFDLSGDADPAAFEPLFGWQRRLMASRCAIVLDEYGRHAAEDLALWALSGLRSDGAPAAERLGKLLADGSNQGLARVSRVLRRMDAAGAPATPHLASLLDRAAATGQCDLRAVDAVEMLSLYGPDAAGAAPSLQRVLEEWVENGRDWLVPDVQPLKFSMGPAYGGNDSTLEIIPPLSIVAALRAIGPPAKSAVPALAGLASILGPPELYDVFEAMHRLDPHHEATVKIAGLLVLDSRTELRHWLMHLVGDDEALATLLAARVSDGLASADADERFASLRALATLGRAGAVARDGAERLRDDPYAPVRELALAMLRGPSRQYLPDDASGRALSPRMTISLGSATGTLLERGRGYGVCVVPSTDSASERFRINIPHDGVILTGPDGTVLWRSDRMTPTTLIVDDAGWVAWSLGTVLTVHAPVSGEIAVQGDLLEVLPVSDRQHVQAADAAAPFWAHSSMWTLLRHEEREYLAIRLWWDRRIAVDLTGGMVLPEVPRGLHQECEALERRSALDALTFGANEMSRRATDWDLATVRRVCTGAHVAGRLRMKDAAPLLRALEEAEFIGTRGGWIDADMPYAEGEPSAFHRHEYSVRRVVQLALRRIGEMPQELPPMRLLARAEGELVEYAPPARTWTRASGAERLRVGMNIAEVLAAMGEPDALVLDPEAPAWEYDIDADDDGAEGGAPAPGAGRGAYTLRLELGDRRHITAIERITPARWASGSLLRDEQVRF